MSPEDPLSAALAAHRAGRPDVAVPLYRTLVAQNPENPDLRHLLALALHGADAGAAWNELARAIALAPSTGLYLHNAARLAGGDETRHLRFLARGLAVDPGAAEAQHRHGSLTARAGRRRAAATRFRRALVLDPVFTPALFDHAFLAAERDDPAAAVAAYRRLLATGDHVQGLGAFGDLLRRLGRPAESTRVIRRLAQLEPARTEVHATLGAALGEAGDDAGAEAALRRALALAPDSAEAWHTLGLLFAKEAARSEDAVAAADRAVLIRPEASDPHLTRAVGYFHQGRVREAIAARRTVLALKPGDAQAHYEFLSFLPLDPDLDPEAHFAWRRRVHRRFSAPLTRRAAPHANDRDPERRLRIGYVDNRMLYRSTHSTNLLPQIEAHDPAAVELHFYTNLPEALADDMTARYRAKAAGFRHTGGLSDEALAQRVRADGIDILVDVASHLTGARAAVMARKPAPIQVTMMQVGSSGMAAMDYAVADSNLLPEDAPTFFSEEVMRLPVGFLFEPVADLTPAIAPQRRRGTPGSPPVFGSLNLLAKSTPPVLALWARVLNAVPHSRLLLKAAGLGDASVRRRLAGFFQARGIDEARLDFRAWTQGYAGHLATFDEIDVVLDCFPYPGMTTTLEALLMGVPVVTRQGNSFVSRLGETIARTVGHPEWIARDEAEYVAIARDLAGDPARLEALKASLRGALLASPFGDPKAFTRSLEAAFRQAWRRWCARQG